jgi:osmotically-inducible protein OsmY
MSNPGALEKSTTSAGHERAVRRLLASLSGCVALVAGGAISGTLAPSDRRTLGAQTEDKSIQFKAETGCATPSATRVTSMSTATTAACC